MITVGYQDAVVHPVGLWMPVSPSNKGAAAFFPEVATCGHGIVPLLCFPYTSAGAARRARQASRSIHVRSFGDFICTNALAISAVSAIPHHARNKEQE